MRQRKIQAPPACKQENLWVPCESLTLRASVLGWKGRPSSCRVTLNGAPLRTTKAAVLPKPSVLCLWRFSDFSRLPCCMFSSANTRKKRMNVKNEYPADETSSLSPKPDLTFHSCYVSRFVLQNNNFQSPVQYKPLPHPRRGKVNRLFLVVATAMGSNIEKVRPSCVAMIQFHM